MFHSARRSKPLRLRRPVLALAGLVVAGTTLAALPADASTAFYAGRGIVRETSGTTAVACTDGFHGRDTDGRAVFITAGHCGAKGTVWKSEKDWRNLGTMSRRTFRTDGSANDWGIIRSNGNYVQGATVIDKGAVKYVDKLGTPGAGQAVCTTGRTSGTRCGHITRVKSNGIILTDMVSQHGDSGSPLFRREAGTNRVVALGILSYGDEKTYTAFQGLGEILRATGVRLKQV